MDRSDVTVDASIDAMLDELIAVYEDLHRHPELSMQETRTARIAADALAAQGFEVTREVGGTGVVGVLENGDGPTVMLRADMDALPVAEATGLPYASNVRTKDADGVEVGPWSIVGPDVEIGEGTVIGPHVVLKGPTRIGKHNRIFQFSSIGEDTPDLKYKGEPTRLVIGDHNVIREGVTIHRGTVQDRAETTVGDHNLIMAYAHIGHDSVIGNHCILVNNTALAGHVHVGDWAILSGYTLVHQYCHIGAHAFSGMGTAIGKDVPAFVTVFGSPAEARSMNFEGMRRRGFSDEVIHVLRRCYKIVYRQGLTVEDALKELAEPAAQHPEVELFRQSILSSARGITR